ncbi:hypothetical protein ACHAPT_010263 [Fusarium lateritium]
MDDRYHDIDVAAGQTCKWLLEHDVFNRWKRCHRGLLWVKGKPGSGKSTLMKFALDSLKTSQVAREGDLLFSFFFHGRGGDLQRSPLGLFRSLVHQFLRQAPQVLPELVRTFEERCNSKGKPGLDWNWHQKELQDHLKSAIRKILETRPVWLFVDALDETGEDNAIMVIKLFKDLIQTLRDPSLPFHICFSCRHYPTLALHCDFEVCLEHENTQDIREYVRAQIFDLQIRTSDTILAQVTNRANGLFLWTRLVVDNVLRLELGGTTEAVAKAIDAVPQDLHELYHNFTETMAKDPQSLKLIEWLCFAMRPLSLDELRWAMIVEHDCPHRSLRDCEAGKDLSNEREVLMRRLKALSCGLIENRPNNRVQFIHQSVRNYFVEKGLIALTERLNSLGNEVINARLVAETAHYRLSRICIRYLATEEISDLFRNEQTLQRARLSVKPLVLHLPLVSYAVEFWLEHEKQQTQKSDILKYFNWPEEYLLQRCEKLRILIRWNGRHKVDMTESPGMAHVLSRQSAIRPLQHLIERTDRGEGDINAKDERGSTALYVAVDRQDYKATKLLLNSATISANSKGPIGSTPFELAIKNGDREIVELFLEKGAVALDSRNHQERTPFMVAVSIGPESMVKFFLEKGGVDVNATDASGRTALALASLRGNIVITDLLLKTDEIDVNQADVQGDITFLRTCQANPINAISLFLKRKWADVNMETPCGDTALLAAARRWEARETVVRLLEEEDIDANARGHDNHTPLSLAAQEGHGAVAEALLESRKVNVNLRGGPNNDTPLGLAVIQGRDDVVKLFLEVEEIEVNAPNEKGETPLDLALRHGRQRIAQLLLGKWGFRCL